ncbi:MAG: glycosyltransferase family 2 protein [Sedimentisphaerales bacterium]
MSPKISIIMATYNGEQYLSEQIKSILEQSNKEWQLIIRDDNSEDNTNEVIKKYTQKYPENIKLASDRDSHIGTSQNFLHLLNHADIDYVMFCDQDDVWLPDKIEITFNKMRVIEEKFGAAMPALIHTDLKVVDKNLNIVSDSFWKFQHLFPQRGKTLNRLLVQNVITGGTVMINKALKNKIKLLPEQIIMYDWWISLVTAAFGKIDYVPKATVLYRQHDSNNIGAKKWSLSYIMNKARLNGSNFKSILQTQLQAKAFLDVFRDELTEKDIDLLNAYSTLSQQSFFIKRLNLIKYSFFKMGFLRNIGLFLFV